MISKCTKVLSPTARTGHVCALYMCDAGWAVRAFTSVFDLDGEHPTIPCAHSECVFISSTSWSPCARVHYQSWHRVTGNHGVQDHITSGSANQSSVCPAVIGRVENIYQDDACWSRGLYFCRLSCRVYLSPLNSWKKKAFVFGAAWNVSDGGLLGEY